MSRAFRPNDYGLIIETRRVMTKRASLAIAVSVIHYVLYGVLLIPAYFVYDNVNYLNVLLALFGLVGVSFLLATAIVAGREVAPGTIGEIDAGKTVGGVAVGALVISVIFAVLAFARDSRSDVPFGIYLWVIGWTLGLILALISAGLLLAAITRYHSVYERARLDECRKKVPATRIAGRVQYVPDP